MFKMLKVIDFVTLIIAVTALIISIVCMNKKCDNFSNVNKACKEEASKFILENVIPNLRNGTDPETATSLFSDDAILLATISSKFRKGSEDILEYFKYFLNISDLKPSKPEMYNTQILADNLYLVNVFVKFTFTENSKKTIINRMSFIVEYKNDYKIKFLHASPSPSSLDID